MWVLASKSLRLLSVQERIGFRLILFIVLLTSVLEILGISSVMPFLAVVSNPDVVRSNPLATIIGLDLRHVDDRTLALSFGFCALIFLILSNVALAWCNWKLMQFTYGLGHLISADLFGRYINQRFDEYIRSSSAEAKKNLLDEAVQVVNSATVPFMQAIAKVPVVILITATLILIQPMLTLIVGLAIGMLYLLMYLTLKRWLSRTGNERVRANAYRFRLAEEAMDAFTEIRLRGIETRFERKYSAASQRFANAQALSMTLASTPKYIFEVLAFGAILLVLLYLVGAGAPLTEALPLITLYVLAAYRLMPALQVILSGVAKARFFEPAMDLLLKEVERIPRSVKGEAHLKSYHQISLHRRIELQDVGYSPTAGSSPILKGVNLIIPAQTIIGIAGSSGSGKTTVARIILGLLEPTVGRVLIDGECLTAAGRESWQRMIGYVSQQIFIADTSLLENIAYGQNDAEIDKEKAIDAAKIANLHDFACSLPEGYSTNVGENGSLLSGGQRQRIAIARSLYNDPQLLVFDEATSALDNAMEDAVMEAIHRVSASRTIILIAHRISTLRQAHRIYIMDDGQIVDSGDFVELNSRGRFSVPISAM
jgi:ATP-binding cassette, subfamily B, bacterial PglK